MHSCKWWSVFNNYIVGGLLLFVTTPGLAAVNVDRMRVIFAADEQEQTLNLSNDSRTPMLLQVWTDNGDPRVTPDQVVTPVVVLPPLFKMLPGEIRALRLVLTTHSDLPDDRESVFWLNVFQMAPMLSDDSSRQEKITLPLRLRLKVFVRPHDLQAPQPQDEKALRFSLTNGGLNIINPTAWHMSLAVTLPGQPPINNLMVSPRDGLMVPLVAPVPSGSIIHYRVITDDGNFREYQQRL
ncbi:fimbrial assembly chaperone [Kluyvera genomosp. 1]|uniref:fimbrial assembly chaperone n=1 Tax=Kluyvera genomosp. 1 TaxID=2774053 RepID=UPI00068FB70F|nr:fimbrial assembly chaperone [Kluyvera genomosp. 1]